jgi:hypothetical protein
MQRANPVVSPLETLSYSFKGAKNCSWEKKGKKET